MGMVLGLGTRSRRYIRALSGSYGSYREIIQIAARQWRSKCKRTWKMKWKLG